jgi:hypothetical protein
MDFNIATKAPSSKRQPGLVECLYAVKDDINILQVPAVNGATPADRVTITQAHVFADPTNGFRKCYISQEKSDAMFKSFGDKDSKGSDSTVDVFIPGITPEVAGFLNEDPELILLIPNGPCGTSEYLQIGDRCKGADIQEWEAKFNKRGGNDSKGVQIKMNAKMSYITFYTAAIPIPD